MKYILVVLAIVLSGIALVTFYPKNSENSYKNITVAELKQYLVENKDIYLLDVHTPEQKHLKGTDDFIPFTEITENKDKLPQDKDVEIVVYCRSGNMSETASLDLVNLGYSNVKNLIGGRDAWVAAGYDE